MSDGDRLTLAQKLEDLAGWIDCKRDGEARAAAGDVECGATSFEAEAIDSMYRALEKAAPEAHAVAHAFAWAGSSASSFFHSMACSFPDKPWANVPWDSRLKSEIEAHLEAWNRPQGAPKSAGRKLPSLAETVDWLRLRWGVGVSRSQLEKHRAVAARGRALAVDSEAWIAGQAAPDSTPDGE